MIRILVVGAGKIGSRHLQALSNLLEDARIFLREPNEENLKGAVELFENAKQRSTYGMSDIELRPVKTFEEVDKRIDVAIISVSSRQRMRVLKEIVSKKIEISHIILEKVLFAKLGDYFELPRLFSNKRTNIYCNEWMSSSYFFKRVKGWLGPFSYVEIEVTGARWGIECNAVHFIDYFDFLLDRKSPLELASENIVRSADSKRAGYVQLFGKISVSAGQRGIIKLESTDEDDSEGTIFVKIRTDSNKGCEFDIKGDNSVKLKKTENGNVSIEQFKLPFQSQLTNLVINELMTTGSSELPNYASAMKHHLAAFKAFTYYFDRVGYHSAEGLPIT